MRSSVVGSTKFSILLALCMAFSFSLVGCDKLSKPKVTIPEIKTGKRVATRGNRPRIAIGGQSAPVDTSNVNAGNSAADAPPAVSTVVDIEGGLTNGLYPQMSASFNQTGFGGGLVPDFQSPLSDDQASDDLAVDDSADNADGSDADQAGDSPEGLLGEAVAAFNERRESDAFKYLYAYVLCDDEAAAKHSLDWYPGIAQPKVAFRWGVGVNYTAPSGFEGKPPVIGDPEDVRLPGANSRSSRSSQRGSGRGGSIGAGGGRPGGGGGGPTGTAVSPYANVDTSQVEGFLLYYTGDFGDRLLTRLESRRRHDDAFYGTLLKDLDASVSAQAVSTSAGSGAAAPTGGRRSIGPGGGGGGAAPAGGNSGVLGASGAGASTNTNLTSSSRLDRVSSNTAAADPDDELIGSLSPGIMLVGQGKKDTLIKRARELGLDGLLMFTVRVSSGRNPTGIAGLKVINLHSDDDEVATSSRSLKSDGVAKKRSSGVSEKSDPVELALDELFAEMLDTKFRAQPMPEKLKPEHVAGRVNQLKGKSHSDPLSVAVEIVSFHRMEMLDAEMATNALDEILGEGKGTVLLTGNSDERKVALANFLPGGSQDDSDDEFR